MKFIETNRGRSKTDWNIYCEHCGWLKTVCEELNKCKGKEVGGELTRQFYNDPARKKRIYTSLLGENEKNT